MFIDFIFIILEIKNVQLKRKIKNKMSNRDVHTNALLDRLPQYNQIIHDLSRGNLKSANDLKLKKSKLCYSLNDLFNLINNSNNNINNTIKNDNNNNKSHDELSYFVLFMDKNNLTNYIKFLLDLVNFNNALINKWQILKLKCLKCNNNNYNNNNKTHSKSVNSINEVDNNKIKNSKVKNEMLLNEFDDEINEIKSLCNGPNGDIVSSNCDCYTEYKNGNNTVSIYITPTQKD